MTHGVCLASPLERQQDTGDTGDQDRGTHEVELP